MDAKLAEGFHCPRWAQLPSLPLYMDQVVLVLEDALAVFTGPGERVVTASMVNNYVKHGLVQAPEKKKYGRNQLAALVVVSVMKRVLSMSEIDGMVRITTDAFGMEPAYDLFCEELEHALRAGFTGEGGPLSAAEHDDPARAALNAAMLALVGKLMLQSRLEGLPPRERPRDKKG